MTATVQDAVKSAQAEATTSHEKITNLIEQNNKVEQERDVLRIELNSHLSVPIINVDDGNKIETQVLPLFVTNEAKKRKRAGKASWEKVINKAQKKCKVKIEAVQDELKQSQQAAQDAADALEDALECCVCMENGLRRDTLVLPCAHLSMCGVCASKQSICPICRDPIKSRIRVHIA